MATHVKRAFKFRFYPTDVQAAELSRTFGCVRKVYNMALAARTEAWALRQERINYNATSAMLTAWKKTEELAYLNDVSSVPLQQTLRHLQGAFTNFFARRAKYPRFKSRKRSRSSAEYTTSGFRFRAGKLTLAKMSEPLDIVWSRPLPEAASPSTVTVSQDAAGRWFVSLLVEDPAVQPLPASGRAVGIDAGPDHLLTLSTGEKIANPRHERRDRARLARAQRDLARKAKGDHAQWALRAAVRTHDQEGASGLERCAGPLGACATECRKGAVHAGGSVHGGDLSHGGPGGGRGSRARPLRGSGLRATTKAGG
ncbi:transposase [Streptomyces sp. NPDC020125]|uniref:RNA-guided endonuclease InsQ/TnpB family protein n=1 Tax=Streptomyces sp. NPDC020125 TaxID=3154593 RepID=UPI0033D1201A